MSISIIVPVYNEEKYLANTLERIKAQKFKDYELIVVCNGCTDKSFNIAKKYADKTFSLKEGNVSKAKNFGVENAKYDKLIFLDADVLIGAELLDAVDNLLDEGAFFGTAKGKGKGIRNNLYLNFKNFINRFRPWSHGFVFCDKKSFFEINGFDESLTRGELRDFFSRAKGKYKRINAYVVPDDRRIRNWGISRLIYYWLFEKNKEEYLSVR